MIVMKFGGSSIKDAERVKYVYGLIKTRLEKKPVIVFSAIGKTTDTLLQAAQNALIGQVDLSVVEEHHKEICTCLDVDFLLISPLFEELKELLKGISLIKELSPKTNDYLVSFGERLAVRIISSYLSSQGVPAQGFDAWEVGMVTDSNFTEAEILPETYANILSKLGHLKESYAFTPIITGFIAKDLDGNVTTFGRGGSDLTASILGAALEAEEIQVWKDVDGIMTTDPRIVKEAKPVPHISFEEASELAYFGAKVLHPLSILPAMKKGIPVRVKNSYNPEHPGSVIVESNGHHDGLIKAITCKRNVTIVDLVSTRMLGQHGFLANVFAIFDRAEISVDMVATSEVSVSLTLNNNSKLPTILDSLATIASVSVSYEKSIISLIGDVKRSSEILNAVFSVLSKEQINVQMISQGASKVNIGFVVDSLEAIRCIAILHQYFFPQTKEAA